MAVPRSREILLSLFKILRENNMISFREAANLVTVNLNAYFIKMYNKKLGELDHEIKKAV